jgi:hypothetical protein
MKGKSPISDSMLKDMEKSTIMVFDCHKCPVAYHYIHNYNDLNAVMKAVRQHIKEHIKQ